LSGKTRASRGSATDPQSLYARVTKTSTHTHTKKNASLNVLIHGLKFKAKALLIYLLFNLAEKKGKDK